jgi:hypothetical protein
MTPIPHYFASRTKYRDLLTTYLNLIQFRITPFRLFLTLSVRNEP